jgi:GNAT superfamily N-acetyltransferase
MILTKKNWLKVKDNLEELFLLSFGRRLPPNYFDWRYLNNNHDEILFSIENQDQNLVASYSAFPVNLIRNGEIFPAAMSMTTMTHPLFRGQGLFQSLANELYEHLRELHIRAIFGFPNSNSHSTFNDKLFWTDIYEVPTLIIDCEGLDTARLVLSLEVLRDDEFIFEYPVPPHDGLIRVHRSKSYLSWRYAKNPVNKYKNFVLLNGGKVSSFVVAKDYGEGLDLVDVQVKNPEEGAILLRHILKLCLDGNKRQVSCWAPTHHHLHGLLERIGFKNSTPITYFGGRELISSAMPLDWLNFKSWYLQMGDSDVF